MKNYLLLNETVNEQIWSLPALSVAMYCMRADSPFTHILPGVRYGLLISRMPTLSENVGSCQWITSRSLEDVFVISDGQLVTSGGVLSEKKNI